ncbi:MAG: 1-(5-phosphoribosyl)-5-amino-4-imidazole-carboxylate carboxylase, partial [Desulfoplanes sp.]
MKRLDQIITAIQQGKLDPETARERLLQTISSVGQGTHLDLARTLRTGNPEVVFCEGKTPEQ